MRFLLTSIRGQGHTRPLIPFAKALEARGHDVAIAAPEDVRSVTDKAGLELKPFDRLSDADVNAHWRAHADAAGDAILRIGVQEMFAHRTARTALPKLKDTMNDWQPDMVLRDTAEFAAFALSEAMGLPHARIGVHNNEVEAKIIALAADPMDALLADLGVPAQMGKTLWAEPAFTMFPAGFDGDAPHGPDNPPFRVNPGANAGTASSDWVPTSDRPLIYVTFGTVAGGGLFDFREVYRMAIEAAADWDADVLLTTGPNIDPDEFGTPPDNVEIRAFVPQAAVLQHASAVMHHGGSGTLSGAFEAGVPMVVVPLFADQPWNAARVEAAGLGVAVTDRSVAAMGAAMTRVLADAPMAERCKAVAAEVARLPGIDAAIDRIEALANRGQGLT